MQAHPIQIVPSLTALKNLFLKQSFTLAIPIAVLLGLAILVIQLEIMQPLLAVTAIYSILMWSLINV